MHAGFWDTNPGGPKHPLRKVVTVLHSRQSHLGIKYQLVTNAAAGTSKRHVLNYQTCLSWTHHTLLPILTFSSQAPNSWTHQHPLKSTLGAAQHSLIYFMVYASQCQLCLLVQNQWPQQIVPSSFLPKTATGSVLHMNRPQHPTGETRVHSAYLSKHQRNKHSRPCKVGFQVEERIITYSLGIFWLHSQTAVRKINF